MTRLTTDPARLGGALIALGIIALLTLRFWASPVVATIAGRETVSVTAFLGIPIVLLLIGAGIVLFIWGPEYVDDR